MSGYSIKELFNFSVNLKEHVPSYTDETIHKLQSVVSRLFDSAPDLEDVRNIKDVNEYITCSNVSDVSREAYRRRFNYMKRLFTDYKNNCHRLIKKSPHKKNQNFEPEQVKVEVKVEAKVEKMFFVQIPLRESLVTVQLPRDLTVKEANR